MTRSRRFDRTQAPWSAVIRQGLMPFARELFARTLAVKTCPVARVRGGAVTA